jgi:hypothetical protein
MGMCAHSQCEWQWCGVSEWRFLSAVQAIHHPNSKIFSVSPGEFIAPLERRIT